MIEWINTIALTCGLVLMGLFLLLFTMGCSVAICQDIKRVLSRKCRRCLELEREIRILRERLEDAI